MKQEKLISNTYSDQDEELFVSEQCCVCEDEMTNLDTIFVTVEDDKYIHLACARKHNIQVVPCLSIDIDID